MGIVTADLMMSLDGFVAGPNDSIANPGGDGAAHLHDWIAGLASWRQRQGLEGGVDNEDSRIIAENFDAAGAVIMGRTMYDYGEKFWGKDPPFKVPVFVLTHRANPTLVKQGGTSFKFVTDGPESALFQARDVCGKKNIGISGGPNTVQQYIRLGLLDELQLHVIPVLFGEGVRLFGALEHGNVQMETIRVIHGEQATHLRYRTVRPPM